VPATDPKNDSELVRPARDGTLRVLKAARDAAVKRVVMTSSVSAIIYGRGVRERPFTEEDWTDETNRRDTSPYDRAKTIAERAAWAWLAARRDECWDEPRPVTETVLDTARSLQADKLV
jgi:dihydroflavonol-4-reductase